MNLSFEDAQIILEKVFADMRFSINPINRSFCAFKHSHEISHIRISFFNGTLRLFYKDFKNHKTQKNIILVDDNYDLLLESLKTFIKNCELNDLLILFNVS